MKPTIPLSPGQQVTKALLMRSLSLITRAAGDLADEHQREAHALLTEFELHHDTEPDLGTEQYMPLPQRSRRPQSAGAGGEPSVLPVLQGDAVGKDAAAADGHGSDRPRIRPTRRALSKQELDRYAFCEAA